MSTLGLCMIVKNEAHCIEGALNSARELVDFVLVCDTGSEDGTQEVVRGWLARNQMDGELFEEKWRNFGWNRTVVLEQLREWPHIDYALMLDADDRLFWTQRPELGDCDLYDVEIRCGTLKWWRPQISSNRLPFVYRGVLHEFLDGPWEQKGRLSGLYVNSTRDGARSCDPQKYQKDAEVLADALFEETDPYLRQRYLLYLGQSWKDCGEYARAFDAYRLRAMEPFGWIEEKYIALLRCGQMLEWLEAPLAKILDYYVEAYQLVPERPDSLYWAARLCRHRGLLAQAHFYVSEGLRAGTPKTGLFLEPWIYEYGLQGELGR